MLLESIVVAGGAFYTIQSYWQRQKRKKESLVNTLTAVDIVTSNQDRFSALIHPGNGAVYIHHNKSHGDKNNSDKKKALSFGDLRQQQFRAISIQDDVEPNAADQKNNRYLAVSLISLACATAGSLLFPPLRLVSVVGLMYTSLPFFKDGFTAVTQKREVNIAVLDALLAGISIATGYYVSWSLACSLLYGGKKVLAKTEDRSRQSLLDIFGLQSNSIWVERDGVEVAVELEQVQIGDIVVVQGGETIPIDGIIVKGIATVDQRILTGESQPSEKDVGDPVFAATILLTGRIYIEVQQAGDKTTAAQIARILAHTADYKSSIQSRGEAYANRSAGPTLALAGVALVTVGPVGMITVLNACFAYYMRVLGPIGMLNFLNLSSHKGILIKDGRILDLLGKVDTIVFDKTGTLTEEQPHVGCIHTLNGYSADAVLAYAAAAEYKQGHPIARAILQEAQLQGVTIPPTEETSYKLGFGLTVSVEGQLVRVGSIRFLESEALSIPPQLQEQQLACHQQGHSLVAVSVDQQVVGAIELLPTIRPEAKTIIQHLRAHHVDAMYIISGDHETPTRKLAQELGIENYFAETLPEHKADLIEQLQQEGKFVCYVGDGINDSIALKKAHVSVSLSGAATIATDTAQVILMNGNLNQLVDLFDIAQEFDANLNRTLLSTMIPGVLTVMGAFFLHFSLIHSIVLNEMGFISGLSNTLLSMRKHRADLDTAAAQVTPSAASESRG